MAKLYFKYGAMGSSKTANALMARYNYIERGQKVLMLKPAMENRDGEKTIKSRIGLSAECIYVEEFIKYVKENWEVIRKLNEEFNKYPGCFTDEQIYSAYGDLEDCSKYDAVIIDEAQFMTEEQVEFMSDIVDVYNIPVLCYGLRADFQNNLFPGSAKLLAIADNIQEIKTVCWCGKKATCNARYNENGIIRVGKQVELGANDKYVALCRKHFKEGKLNNN